MLLPTLGIKTATSQSQVLQFFTTQSCHLIHHLQISQYKYRCWLLFNIFIFIFYLNRHWHAYIIVDAQEGKSALSLTQGVAQCPHSFICKLPEKESTSSINNWQLYLYKAGVLRIRPWTIISDQRREYVEVLLTVKLVNLL